MLSCLGIVTIAAGMRRWGQLGMGDGTMTAFHKQASQTAQAPEVLGGVCVGVAGVRKVAEERMLFVLLQQAQVHVKWQDLVWFDFCEGIGICAIAVAKGNDCMQYDAACYIDVLRQSSYCQS